MGKIIKISPIQKEHDGHFKTMESSLAGHGFIRHPGTRRILTPRIEADGRYRTGLDKSANYIKALPTKEDKDAELKLIDELSAQLEETFGKYDPSTKTGIDFSPRSRMWNVWGEGTLQATPIALGNGDVILNTDDPQDLINYCWARQHPDLAKSMDAYLRRECPDCQYYIANDEAESRMQYRKNKSVNEAIGKFDSLTPAKSKQVARLMGLPVVDDTTPEAVYNMMDSLLKTGKFKNGEFEGIGTIAIFERILSLTDDELYTKDLLEQALRFNIYRMKGDLVMEGAEQVGVNKTEFVKYMMDSNNQKELLALEARVKAKKIAEL